MAGADEFIRRTRMLEAEVGVGEIVARCTVDQPYAQDQHETLHYKHYSGGQAKYLGGPLMQNALDLAREIARNAITATGSDIHGTMIQIAEQMAGYVAINAPIDTGRLRESGAPDVRDNGFTIYSRPAIAPRERG